MPVRPDEVIIQDNMRCMFSYYDMMEECTILDVNHQNKTAIIQFDNKKTRLVSLRFLKPIIPKVLTSEKLEFGNKRQIDAIRHYGPVLEKERKTHKKRIKEEVQRELEESQITLDL